MHSHSYGIQHYMCPLEGHQRTSFSILSYNSSCLVGSPLETKLRNEVVLTTKEDSL